MSSLGPLITFEGIDGAGKSSHVDWFCQQVEINGFEVLRTREPGGTPLAEDIRAMLLERAMPELAELLMMFAARCEHLETVIRPALERGAWVVCDRFTDSTYAYQGGGRGAELARIATLEQWVQGDLQPTRTFMFDLDPETAARRRGAVRVADRFESEDTGFFERVRAAYLARAQAFPERFVRIDGALEIADIRTRLAAEIDILLGRRRAGRADSGRGGTRP